MNIYQYTIGRGDECQIRIEDSTQRISRHHATIKVLSSGKIFITDHSTNGTFVNGIKLSKGVDYPIKRGDSVSFANISELNWALIPNRKKKVVIYIVLAVLIILIGLALGKYFLDRQKKIVPDDSVVPVVPVAPVVDSTEIREKEAKRVQYVKDSTEQAKKDSLLTVKEAQLKEKEQDLNEEKRKQKESTEKEEKDRKAKDVKDKNQYIL